MNKSIITSLFSAVFVCMLFACGTQVASAVPAPPFPIDVVGDDGSVTSIIQHGDERYHYVTNIGGELLIPSEMGYRKATEDDLRRHADRLGARRAPTAPEFGRTGYPTTGRPRTLIILVEFADNQFTIDDPHKAYTEFLTDPGYNRDGATGSVRDYFIASSGMQLSPQFDLYGPVKLSQPYSYYGRNLANGDDAHPDEMVTEACALLDDIIDFHTYDVDHDGVIDNVYIFYAGYGEHDTAIRNAVWPHSWDIAVAKPAGAGREVYFDGVLINHYACSNELRGGTTEMAGIGTFIHEFGHVLGLPDLYATRSSSAFTPGAYSVMDRGNYNNNCHTPPYHSGYERYCLGWVDPFELSEAADITLESPGTGIGEHEAVALLHTDNPNEYFIIENRQQGGWDEYIPGHGMLIWHIDYDPEVWNSNICNINSSHQHVDLIEADNIRSSSTRAGDPFPGTADVRSFNFTDWSGNDLQAPITDITETSPYGDITFKFRGGASVGNIPAEQDDAPAEYFDIMGRMVSEPAPGQLLIERRGNVSRLVVK